jgi:methionyl-tRNA synthetase
VLESQARIENGKKLCPECGAELTWKSEESYFFRWTNYQKQLEDWLKQNPKFIEPQFRANEMINSFLKPGLQDISVSRTSINWGIPVPGDPAHVMYVWFDALINYITGVGYGTDDARFKRWWPADVHVIGKDILKWHTLLWPAMCWSAGIEPPRHVFGHGFVSLRPDEKMSKSKGNVVNPRDVVDQYNGNPDPLRYFLLREIDFGGDGLYSDEALAGRYNSDLADKLGNLLSRSLTMAEKYVGGQITPPESYQPQDEQVIAVLQSLFELTTDASGRTQYEQLIDDCNFNQLLERIFAGIQRLNLYITDERPFTLAKDPANASRVATIMYVLCEGLRVAASQLYPFIPGTCEKIWVQLGAANPLAEIPFEELRRWGYLQATKIQRGENLFPKQEETVK